MLMTKDDITNYLQTSGIADNYVCGDGTFCDMFSRRVLPDKVFTQTSLGNNLPARNWWIEYLSEQNKFVLRCSYFDTNGVPITREQFIDALKSKFSNEKINSFPAVQYTPESIIEWLPTGEGEWTATYSVPTRTSGCMIVGALSKILLKPTAISTPVPVPTPTATYCIPGCIPGSYQCTGDALVCEYRNSDCSTSVEHVVDSCSTGCCYSDGVQGYCLC